MALERLRPLGGSVIPLAASVSLERAPNASSKRGVEIYSPVGKSRGSSSPHARPLEHQSAGHTSRNLKLIRTLPKQLHATNPRLRILSINLQQQPEAHCQHKQRQHHHPRACCPRNLFHTSAPPASSTPLVFGRTSGALPSCGKEIENLSDMSNDMLPPEKCCRGDPPLHGNKICTNACKSPVFQLEDGALRRKSKVTLVASANKTLQFSDMRECTAI